MKIYICFNFKSNPQCLGGGGNFLKALKNQFIELNIYTEDPKLADIILFNSHHCFKEIINLKRKFSDKIFLHRIDGPMSLYNKHNDMRDKIVILLNRLVADGTIFQSYWSQTKMLKLGIDSNILNAIIHNAPNKQIFNRSDISLFNNCSKVQIVCSGWSTNQNKGFDILLWLDNYLNFDKYNILFIGRCPIAFKNIQISPPVQAYKLAEYLKSADIYLFCSEYEACSNALLEALHCGLPVLARNSSSMPEIIKGGGILFDTAQDIPQLLERLIAHYSQYCNAINVSDIVEVAKHYLSFTEEISKNIVSFKKNLNITKISLFYIKIYYFKMRMKINNLLFYR